MSEPGVTRAVAAVGDVADVNCWSGTPYHFWRAAAQGGLAGHAVRLDLRRFDWARRRWNLGRLARGASPGGYQYSEAFLAAAEATVPPQILRGEIITFHQHFPRSAFVRRAGGRLLHYVDATFASACGPGGFAATLPGRVKIEAMDLERQNYAESRIVVTMARWAADSAIRSCGVAQEKVHTILPGANLDVPAGYEFSVDPRLPGSERPLVLGFVGKDWKRKGLPFLLEVRNALERMEVKAVVRAAGICPRELLGLPGLEYVGFIDKARDPVRFLDFLAGCDLGCLFSDREPLGISTLEFLRAGVLVAGFEIEGLADTLPPDAGFRIAPGTRAADVAESIRAVLASPAKWAQCRRNARAWSRLVTWERCTAEWLELLQTGRVSAPVQPWRGLEQPGA
jgi:glycosyltransferase involved in cell wall biosynthesis